MKSVKCYRVYYKLDYRVHCILYERCTKFYLYFFFLFAESIIVFEREVVVVAVVAGMVLMTRTPHRPTHHQDITVTTHDVAQEENSNSPRYSFQMALLQGSPRYLTV